MDAVSRSIHIQEGTITTAIEMTVCYGLDRFHLVMDVIDCLSGAVP